MTSGEVPVNPTHTTAAMTTTSGTVLAASAARRSALIVNDGAVDVYINLSATAVANQGIRLNANGGSYAIGPAYGNLYLGIVTGITATGTATLLVTQGV